MNSFRQWLRAQVDRNDMVGDFARDAVWDEARPRTQAEWRRHLVHLNACEGAFDAMERAFDEYGQRQWQ
jgi:hypothetical protein